MSDLSRIDALIRPVTPAARLGAVRLLVGGFVAIYMVVRFPQFWRLSEMPAAQFRPVGILGVLDQGLVAWQWQLILVLTTLLAFAFALGYRHKILGPLFGLALLVTVSYRNSFGMIFHTENLMVLHVLLLAIAPSADAWSLDRRRSDQGHDDSWKYGWPLFLMCLITVVAYALAGYAKLRFGGFSWASGDVLRNYVASDNVRKILLGDTYSPLAAPAMRLHLAFNVLATGSLVLEIFAPLSLFSKRFARLWVPGVVGFHLGILALMAISFPYPISGVAFASFYHAEKLLDRIKNSKWLAKLPLVTIDARRRRNRRV